MLRHLTPTLQMASFSFLLAVFLALSAIRPVAPAKESVLDPRQSPGWEFVGCYTNNATVGTLRAQAFVNSSMTPGLCMEFCGNRNNFPPSGYGFSGLQFDQCFCDGVIQLSGNITDPSECNLFCEGDEFKELTCGGNERLSIYTNGTPSPKIPTAASPFEDDAALAETIPVVFNYVGCYSDSPENRTLDMFLGVLGDINQCSSACDFATEDRFNQSPIPPLFAGSESGGECWCGTSVSTSAPRLPDIACESLGCNGINDQACGGEFIMALYQSPVQVIPPMTACDFNERAPTTDMFQLEAVLVSNPSERIPLTMVSGLPLDFIRNGLANITEAGILSFCATCPGTLTFNISDGELLPNLDSGLFLRPQVPPVRGGAVNFVQITTAVRTFGAYCFGESQVSSGAVTLNPIFQQIPLPFSAPSDAVFDPNFPWLLCINETLQDFLHAATPIQDIVYKPLTFQPGFNLSECKEVELQVVFP
ncbi:hypothetical protein BDZ97DRAFT_2074600 [Flammula alnicola]|nr:hypothetical protein BDZ97DRAFT_2074600 [Flammula alnicola]